MLVLMRNYFLIVLFTFCIPSLVVAEADRPTLAVLTLESKSVDTGTLEAVTDALQSKFDDTNAYVLVERSRIEAIVKEQAFQFSGSVNENTAVQIGKMLGAQKLVVGSLNRFDNVYVLSARIVNVESGIIERSWTETTKSVLHLNDAVFGLVDNLICERDLASPTIHYVGRKESIGIYCLVNNGLFNYSAVRSMFTKNDNPYFETNVVFESATKENTVQVGGGFRYQITPKIGVLMGVLPGVNDNVAYQLNTTVYATPTVVRSDINFFYKNRIMAGCLYSIYKDNKNRFDFGVGALIINYEINNEAYNIPTGVYRFHVKKKSTEGVYSAGWMTLEYERLLLKRLGLSFGCKTYLGDGLSYEPSVDVEDDYSHTTIRILQSPVIKAELRNFVGEIKVALYF